MSQYPVAVVTVLPAGETPGEGGEPGGEGADEIDQEGAWEGARHAGHAPDHVQAPEGDGRQGGRAEEPHQAREVAAGGHRRRG